MIRKIGAWLVSVLVAVGTVLALIFRPKASPPMVEHDLEEAKVTVEVAKDRQADRKKRADKLADRLKKLPPFVLILAMLITVPVQAADPAYDELLFSYKEAVRIAQEYKELYEEAEVDLDAMVEQNKKLQALVREQQDIIKGLLSSKLSLSAGVTADGDGLGLVALATYRF